MAGKSAKITETQYIKLCNDINDAIESAYQAIKSLNTDYTALMKGDKDGPYWNGSLARSFYSTAKRNLENDMVAYQEAAEAWTKLRNRYITLCKKGYFS